MHHRVHTHVVLGFLCLFGCAPDSAPKDPVDPGPKPGPEWAHCPTTDVYEAIENWTGMLDVTNGAVYCERPQQHDDMARTLQLRRQMRLVAGRYPLPTSGDTHDIELPFCFRDDEGPLDNASAGTASAGIEEHFSEGVTWIVRGRQNHGTAGAHLNWTVMGDPDDTYVLVDGTELYGESILFDMCDTELCTQGERSLFTACTLPPTTCDSFSLAGGDALSLSQYHWVGPVGGGFASITEAKGQLAGQPFTISDPSQLFMTYGHHAFTRSATVFFDAPIDGACGVYVDEVTGNSTIWTVDCAGTPMDPLVVTDEVHGYQTGPCP